MDISASLSSDREQEIMALFNSEGETLPHRMGIRITEVAPGRVVGTMPVTGNTQPYGLLHGGASCVLAETLGSCGAALQAGPDHGRHRDQRDASSGRDQRRGHRSGDADTRRPDHVHLRHRDHRRGRPAGVYGQAQLPAPGRGAGRADASLRSDRGAGCRTPFPLPATVAAVVSRIRAARNGQNRALRIGDQCDPAVMFPSFLRGILSVFARRRLPSLTLVGRARGPSRERAGPGKADMAPKVRLLG